jgi:hypothetical protein
MFLILDRINMRTLGNDKLFMQNWERFFILEKIKYENEWKKKSYK